MRGIKDEEREMECQNKDRGDDGEQEEVKAESGVGEVAESSFQQSFMAMDEPPIVIFSLTTKDNFKEANHCFSYHLNGPCCIHYQGRQCFLNIKSFKFIFMN